MTPTEAGSLAETATRSWPDRGVDRTIWQTALEPLDYDPALAAIVQLIETSERAPSIATFKAMYRAQRPTPQRLHSACDLCGGDGWEPIEAQRPRHMVTTGVVPCRCSAGRANHDVWQRALDHNDRELGRTRTVSSSAA